MVIKVSFFLENAGRIDFFAESFDQAKAFLAEGLTNGVGEPTEDFTVYYVHPAHRIKKAAIIAVDEEAVATMKQDLEAFGDFKYAVSEED